MKPLKLAALGNYVLAFTLLPLSAMAAPDDSCKHCVHEPVPATGLTFAQARAKFEEAKVIRSRPSSDELAGTWDLVLLLLNPEMPDDVSQRFDRYTTDEFREDGIKNNDNQPIDELNFTKRADWTDNDKALSAYVNCLGSGRYDRDPSDVKFNEQGASFGYYDGSGNAYYDMQCRFVDAKRNRLLCSKSPNGDGWADSQKSWLGKVIKFEGYVRREK